MSEDDDFARFMEAARADHAVSSLPPETTRGIEASVAAHVSWRRRLPAGLAAALAMTAGAAAARTGSSSNVQAARGPWIKVLAAVVPAIGLAVVSYSTIGRAPAPGASIEGAASAPVVATPSSLPVEAAAPTLARPSDLPDVRDLPDAPPVLRAKPAAPQVRRSSDETLEAELALLAEASSALLGKRPASALALVEEHDRRFPKGVLVPEFAAQRVLALAALGRHAEACSQSARFLEMYPKSSLVSQVRSACVDPSSNR